MARMSTARTTIDFDRSGKQIGFVDIPHSPHEDAWGATRIPLAVISNGTGPTVILQAGNHGDEYEGPITLGELIRDLDPGMVSGRIIFLPAINLPAVLAGRRTSPVDGLNLNRTFPGDPSGTITQQISAYVSDVVMPLGDAYVDLHSGGSSLNILPSAIIEPAPDAAHRKRNMEAVLAFDAPLTVVIDNLGEPRTSTATSVRAGLTTVGTEMAGAGTVSLDALGICRRGVRNVLSHLGVLPPTGAPPVARPENILRIPGHDGYVLATDERRVRAVSCAGHDRACRRGGRPHPQSRRSAAARRRPCVTCRTASSTVAASPAVWSSAIAALQSRPAMRESWLDRH